MDIGALMGETLFKTLMDVMNNPFTMLITIITVIIVLVIIVWITKMIIDLAPYAYVNARIRSREGKLLDSNKLNELIEAGSFEEILGLLADTDYSEFIETLEKKDPLLVERAFDTYLANLYTFIYNISPDSAKKVLKILIKKYDIQNIKTLLRAKYLNLKPEEIHPLLIPLGELKDKLRDLTEVGSVEEIVRGLEGTEYFKILQEILPEYEQTKKLLPLELALDKYYLESLKKEIMIEGKEEDLFREFIGLLIDIENLKVLLKAKSDNLPADEIIKYLTDGYELPLWKLKELAGASGIEGVISGLEGTSYSQILAEKLEEFNKTKSVYVFEKALDNYLVDKSKRIALRKPFGLGPILSLIIAKESEVKKLKTIIKGKLENLNPEEIKSLVS
ncbi:V-type ATP synthase subunit C [Methanocaldococcus indicus]|uniref:V-type ATP synthase subunit C n=1 Tax=Methanocaldococcus indicus TaxID=213231 RepID=UPI003C6D30B5